MARCAAHKPNGEPCERIVSASQTYCFAHAPENAEKRRRMASKAAKSKPNRELRDIKALCEDLTERVLAGDLLPGPAAVANQFINTRLRAIEQERKNKESDELEARIEALEQTQEQAKGARRWQRH
jgi:hypothetical protein